MELSLSISVMKNKILAILLCLSALLSCICTAHAESASVTYTVSQVQSLCDGIIAYNEARYGAGSIQDYIDGYLCDNAGTTAEFYVIALSQSGNYRFSSYENALLSYLRSHEVYSAASREKYALALSAAGSTDSYIKDTADEAIGESGVMSLVFGLHLLNNGYSSVMYSKDGLIREILSYRKNDGGWAVTGSWGDADVTAMAIQALAPYYGSRSDVTNAVDAALGLLSDIQLDSGGFKSMGAENCESAAQVIIALSALGIDAQYDSRFIKNGNSAIAGMLQYRLSDGSFSHTGGEMNDTATAEAFCALTAYLRMCRGQGSLYRLDHVKHNAPNAGNSSAQGNVDGGKKPAGNSASRSDNGGYDSGAKTDNNGNRIGGSYIEATTATGEKVTVNVSETESIQQSETTSQKPTYGGFQPSATADMRVTATADESGKGGYKSYAVLGVVLIAGGVCAVLFLLKKRNKKHYIAVAVLAAAGIVFILLTDFQSTEDYRANTTADGDRTVTMSIRCDTINGLEKINDFIPDDGVIIDKETYHVSEGDTVYDVLLTAANENNLPLDNRGADGAAYIAGLNCLYEFDYGPLSGWMYRVNGEFTDVGCQSYYVHDGDKIEWLYTLNIGKDLE